MGGACDPDQANRSISHAFLPRTQIQRWAWDPMEWKWGFLLGTLQEWNVSFLSLSFPSAPLSLSYSFPPPFYPFSSLGFWVLKGKCELSQNCEESNLKLWLPLLPHRGKSAYEYHQPGGRPAH